MVQLCSCVTKTWNHISPTSAFLPIATFASVACMPRKQQPGNNSLYVCMHFNYILHHEHAKMMVLWRMFLRLKRSSVDTPSLLLPTTGFFSWQAGRNFPLSSAILSKTALASSSRSLTSSHLGDSGASLQCHETVLLWVSGLSVLEGLAVYTTKSMYAALQVT